MISYSVAQCLVNPKRGISSLRVTDETLIVETAVWPIPFLINVFTALKGSQF